MSNLAVTTYLATEWLQQQLGHTCKLSECTAGCQGLAALQCGVAATARLGEGHPHRGRFLTCWAVPFLMFISLEVPLLACEAR